MRKTKTLALLGAAMLAGASVAVACGPDFPWQLFDDRAATLTDAPETAFAFEMRHLAEPPADGWKAVEANQYAAEETLREARAKADAEGLTAAQAKLLAEARAADSGDEALRIGRALPDAVRLYAAGAVDFDRREFARAEARFRQVLALPEDRQRLRGVWAAYMLGRTAGDPAKQREQFRRVRALAGSGMPDPLGLAVASFGAEAKPHYDKAAAMLAEGELPPEAAVPFATEMAAAAALYAQQAARGSDSGRNSLRMIAEKLLADPESLRATVGDPLLQRLLVAYVLSRSDVLLLGDDGDTPGMAPVVSELIDAIEARKIQSPVGADRLAALAYRAGRYDMAARLAPAVKGPLSAWVQAKLALQKGDIAAATGLYAEATRAFPAADALEENVQKRLLGEQATLTLARGEYVMALTQLWPVAGTYWGDIAHLAERVLTTDELRQFVDANAPPESVQPSGSRNVWALEVTNRPGMLRDLLARRLVRDGRFAEAEPYFHAAGDKHFQDPEILAHVQGYAAALAAAQDNTDPVRRAEAWWRAALLARNSGMEMMGTEGGPDYFVYEGAFDRGLAQPALEGPFVTKGEQDRYAAAAAKPDQRYHYRYIAVAELEQAANLLPPRSQAFAAVLCQGAGWMMETPDQHQRELALYRRYVREGAHVKWAAHFGRDCPAPDFEGAAKLARAKPWNDTKAFLRKWRWPLAVVALLGVGGGALLVRRRRAVA